MKQDAVEFSDFNFKLAVIDHLMYELRLIKPDFEIFDFAKKFKGREIDVNAEGDAVIPEALQFFSDIEVFPEQLAQIEHIGIDGGCAIYTQIIPFWDGEDDYFDIRSFQDVIHLPNLKSVLICSLVSEDVDLAPLHIRNIAVKM